jgi:hypothetical protein
MNQKYKNDILSQIYNPARDVEQLYSSRMVEAMRDAFRTKEDILSSSLKGLSKLSHSMNAAWMPDLVKGFEEASKAAQNIYPSAFFNGIAASMKLQKELDFSGIAKWMMSSKELSQQYDYSKIFAAFDSTRDMQEVFPKSAFSKLAELSKDIADVEYEIDEDGALITQDATFSQSEVQAKIDSIIETRGEDTTISFEQKIARIVRKLVDQHPAIAVIVLHVIIPIIINLFMSTYAIKAPAIDYHRLARELKTQIGKIDVNNDFYIDYRFVSTRELVLRSKHTVKSEAEFKLHYGALVKVIMKKRNWTFIEYHDCENSISVRGWVFSRYLERFN